MLSVINLLFCKKFVFMLTLILENLLQFRGWTYTNFCTKKIYMLKYNGNLLLYFFYEKTYLFTFVY